MTLSVFLSVLQDEDSQAIISTAPKLAEALRPLWDNVRLCAPKPQALRAARKLCPVDFQACAW